jgi:amidohydrolase
MTLLNSAKELQPYLQNIRRELHQFPEISLQEKNTSEILLRELKKIDGIQIRENVAGYGIIADFYGEKPGKLIALRADMDALQIEEKNDVEWKSKNPGVMHACGHDNHMTMVLGAALLFNKNKSKLSGGVRLIFQPAEELSPNGGAKDMIKAGALENVDMILGMHVWPDLPLGKIGLKSGALMAASDHFTINIKGKSSHAAKPNEGIDALVAGAQFINQCQTIVSRNTDPMQSIVITIGKMNSGTRYNIVAEECILEGTCRTFSPNIRDLAEKRLETILKGVCISSGCSGTLNYERGYSAVINNEEIIKYIRTTIEDKFKKDDIVNVEPCMTAEDFSHYLLEKPGALLWIGTTKEGETKYPLHSSYYSPNEEVLWKGSALLAELVLNYK